MQAIQLDFTILAEMYGRFLRRIPDFGDFTEREGVYWREERAYKDELVALAGATLTRELLADDSDAGAARVVAAARHVLTARLPSIGQPQNLVNWRYTEFLGRMDAAERRSFARALRDLLFGDGDSPARAAAFTQAMWRVFLREATSKPYAQARIVPTFFLMLADPERDVAVRTDMFAKATRRLLGRSLLRDAPFGAEEYRDVLAFTLAVRRALEGRAWCPRDMIDVHSFLWIVTTETYAVGAATTPPTDEGER